MTSGMLFLHSSDDLYGADRVLLSMVDAALEDSRSVRVLLPDDVAPGWLGTQLEGRGVAVRRVPLAVARRRYLRLARLPSYVVQLAKARRALKAELTATTPDIVHVNTSALPVAAAIRGSQRPRVVWHVHELVVAPRAVAWALRNLPMWAADDVVAISDAVAANLRLARRRRARLHRVHNGIPPRPVRDGARSGSPQTVTFVGRLSRWKGYEVFVEAAAMIAAQVADVRFQIAGTPPPGEEWRADDLRRRLAAHGLDGYTDVLGNCEDVAALFDRSNVVAVPSLWPEPFGLVIVEAMAAGCAVVATDHGAAGEIIDDGLTGVLVPPGEPAALAAAIEALLRDGIRRRNIATRAAETVRAGFSEDRFRSEVRAVWNVAT